MRRRAIGILAFFAIIPKTLLAQPSAPPIPPAYWGEFSPNPSFCGMPIYVDDSLSTDRPSNNRIWVGADHIRYGTRKRNVVAVSKSRWGLTLQFDLRMDEFPPPNYLELSKDGEILNRRWHRCQMKRK